MPLSVSPSHQLEKVSWWSNGWTTGGIFTMFSLPVVHTLDHQQHYSFFNSSAGFVFAALRVCQRTVPKAMAREMITATRNTQP